MSAVTRLPQESGGRVYRGFAWLAVRLLSVSTRPRWRGYESIPPGGVLIVSNHISNFDPLTLGHCVLSGARRWPRFIGKSDIWRVPGLGWLARACGQIPVERNSARARDVIAVAVERLAQGQVVCLYPEGTITADPQGWPMRPRSGAARIALASAVPVIPVGQWGAHEMMPGKELSFPRFWRKPVVDIVVGEPVDLSDLDPDTEHAVAEASGRISRAITCLVEEIRGESAPTGQWDMRINGRVEQLRGD